MSGVGVVGIIKCILIFAAADMASLNSGLDRLVWSHGLIIIDFKTIIYIYE